MSRVETSARSFDSVCMLRFSFSLTCVKESPSSALRAPPFCVTFCRNASDAGHAFALHSPLRTTTLCFPNPCPPSLFPPFAAKFPTRADSLKPINLSPTHTFNAIVFPSALNSPNKTHHPLPKPKPDSAPQRPTCSPTLPPSPSNSNLVSTQYNPTTTVLITLPTMGVKLLSSPFLPHKTLELKCEIRSPTLFTFHFEFKLLHPKTELMALPSISVKILPPFFHMKN